MLKTRHALSALTLAALSLAGGSAWSLGLGRLQIQSALGETLRAEIDITSLTPEERQTLTVRLASTDTYKAAGVEYQAVLAGTRVTLDQRPDGRPVLRVTSDRVVMEPFVDVILELTWASGRLVREYTVLLDPPRAVAASAPAVTAVSPVISSAPAAPAPAPAAAPAGAAPAERAARASAPAPAKPPAAAGGSEVKVKPGDTLSRIAAQVSPPNVSLDQMLVSLLRANPDAFAGQNMNRLKSGATLRVPAEAEVRQISASEARDVIQAQSADFGAYRQRLASGAPAAVDAPARQVTGKVEAAVQDRKQAAAPAPDKLKLTQGSAKAASAPEARLSKGAEKKAGEDRAAELARNLEELKKLRGEASAQKAPVAPPAPAVAAAPTAAPAPAPAPVPAPAPAAAPPAVAATPPSPAPAPASAAPPAAPVVAATPPVAPPKPAEPPKPATPAPAAGGVMDAVLDSPYLLPGAGALLVALGAGAVVQMRRRRREEETSFLESRGQRDSFFGASGGQRIDTADAGGPSTLTSSPSSMSYSLSQLDAIGDVDPVAEADVYLAYGRDMQAEEILKEAMRVTPDRLAIRMKLLEVYAKRRDTKGFEMLAGQLHGLTQGKGEDWSRAQELGRSIDPDNPMYKPGGSPSEGDGDEIIEALAASTQPAPASLTMALAKGAAPAAGVAAAAAAAFAAPAAPELAPAEPSGLDFDLGTPSVAPEVPAPVEPALGDLPPLSAPEPEPAAAPAPAPAADSGTIEFDMGGLTLDLSAPAPPVEVPDLVTDSHSPSLSPLELDLGSGAEAAPASGDEEALQRKLELADEFRQIGDLEGARDLLGEVVANASGALKAKAEQMLARLT